MLNYIDAHIHELAVHLLAGAHEWDLTARLAIPPAGIMLTVNIIVALIFKRLDVLLVTLLFSALLLFTMMLLPFLKIKRKKLRDILQER